MQTVIFKTFCAMLYTNDMKNILIFGGILLCAAILSPSHASAYFMKDERVLKISETTSIYFIDYTFGHEDYVFYMPVLAARDQAHGSELTSVGYEVLKDGETRSDAGTTHAIVLSNASINDGMYKTQEGFANMFTLAVVLTTPEDASSEEYAIHVTDLPFYRGEEKEYMRLNPSELQYYITDESSFNESNRTGKFPFTVSISDIKYTVLED